MFTEEGRKNKYPSLYNHSAFVVASIHSLVFEFSRVPSLPMLPRILSPIVPLYWWCLQSNSYDQDLFMSCAAAFCVVTQCSSLVLDLLSSAVNEQDAFLSQSQRQHSPGKREKEKATSMSPTACNKSFGNPKKLIEQNNDKIKNNIVHTHVSPSIFAATLFLRLQLTIN